MAKHANSVTGFNSSGYIIPECTPVVIGQRINASGISDDMCFEVVEEDFSDKAVIGITTCALYPGMAGKIIISGIAETYLPDFFDSGDSITPDGNGSWCYSDSGKAAVVSSADGSGIGVVFIKEAGRTNVNPFYRGQFSIIDNSDEEGSKITVYGGNTDLGYVMSRNFSVDPVVSIYLMAEYVYNDDGTGYYRQKLTADYPNERESDEYALWFIGTAFAQVDKNGKNCVEIVQEWNNGEVYWGSRFWI